MPTAVSVVPPRLAASGPVSRVAASGVGVARAVFQSWRFGPAGGVPVGAVELCSSSSITSFSHESEINVKESHVFHTGVSEVFPMPEGSACGVSTGSTNEVGAYPGSGCGVSTSSTGGVGAFPSAACGVSTSSTSGVGAFPSTGCGVSTGSTSGTGVNRTGLGRRFDGTESRCTEGAAVSMDCPQVGPVKKTRRRPRPAARGDAGSPRCAAGWPGHAGGRARTGRGRRWRPR